MLKYVTLLVVTSLIAVASIAIGESLDRPFGMNMDEPAAVVVPSVLVPEVIAENDELEVGQLARLEAVGDKVDWTCVPAIQDGQAFGNSYVCSFREPGTYHIAAAIVTGEDVRIIIYTLTVLGPPEPPAPPAPPAPPEPVVPTNDLNKVTSNATLKSEVSGFAKSTRSNKKKTTSIAAVFASVAGQIRSKELTQGGAIILRTAELNKELNLNGMYTLMSRLQTLITKRGDSGLLETPSQYLELWLSISEGLREYAEDNLRKGDRVEI